MIWRIFDIVKLATFMLFKLVLFMCLAQGYTKSEKEKLSEYDRNLFFMLTVLLGVGGETGGCLSTGFVE